jgi:hypothetical protein
MLLALGLLTGAVLVFAAGCMFGIVLALLLVISGEEGGGHSDYISLGG